MARPQKRLDRKATILAPEVGKDAAGGVTKAFKPFGPERYCHREDRGGRETRGADALRSEADAVFTLRWFEGLTTKHRIVCEGVQYDIVAPPAEEGRRQFLIVQTKASPTRAQ